MDEYILSIKNIIYETLVRATAFENASLAMDTYLNIQNPIQTSTSAKRGTLNQDLPVISLFYTLDYVIYAWLP